jgi:uroporphyrinogen III methyltransferase/synthase
MDGELPLAGRRVLITRAANQGDDLRRRLEALGAEVLHAPLIRIAPPADARPLERACLEITTFDWMVVTSANGAAALATQLARHTAEAGADAAGAGGRFPRVCAVGPATADCLRAHGQHVDLIPEAHRAEGVVGALTKSGVSRGSRVLFVRGEQARDVVGAGLRQLGAEVVEVAAYRTVLEPLDGPGRPPVTSLLRSGGIDAIVFTSGSTVRSFAAAAGAANLRDALESVVVACIGPVTADAVRDAGFAVAVVASSATSSALASALAHHFETEGQP